MRALLYPQIHTAQHFDLTCSRHIAKMHLRTNDHLHVATLFSSPQAILVVTMPTSSTLNNGPPITTLIINHAGGNADVNAITIKASNAPTSPLRTADQPTSRSTRNSTDLRSQPTIASKAISCRLPRNSNVVHKPTVSSAVNSTTPTSN